MHAAVRNLQERRTAKVYSDTVRQRVEWLRSLGAHDHQIVNYGLDREMPDLCFQVLLNGFVKNQKKCFPHSSIV